VLLSYGLKKKSTAEMQLSAVQTLKYWVGLWTPYQFMAVVQLVAKSRPLTILAALSEISVILTSMVKEAGGRQGEVVDHCLKLLSRIHTRVPKAVEDPA
jgi:hypothetical protein